MNVRTGRLKQEANAFLAALMFYTRIPCPAWFERGAEDLGGSRRYFVFIGWIVGGVGVVSFWCLQLVLPASVALLLSMAATVLATGAFHEDGFADVCDGFGGGWSRQQILSIMKDSRIGTYGTVGVVLLLAVKFAALYEILRISVPLMLITLLNGHTLSRFMASMVVQTHAYVQDLDKSKSKPIATTRLSRGETLLTLAFVVLPLLLLLPDWPLLLAVVPAYLSKWYLAGYFERWIGGYTGDCLGATQQVSETVFYIALLALCGFI